jgi:hypothetical protein
LLNKEENEEVEEEKSKEGRTTRNIKGREKRKGISNVERSEKKNVGKK